MLNKLRKAFASFQDHDVRYVVIGGIAAAVHGVPRATFDLDILIEASPENAERLLKALAEAGFGTAFLTDAADLLSREITVFDDYVRIHVQTATPGLDFDSAWEHRIALTWEGRDIFVASRQDLIASKRAAGRPVDLEDVRALELPTEDDPPG